MPVGPGVSMLSDGILDVAETDDELGANVEGGAMEMVVEEENPL